MPMKLVALLFLCPVLQAVEPLKDILFGSCIDQFSHPMLDQAAAQRVDLALLIGDNIYADRNMTVPMATMYSQLSESSFMGKLMKQSPVLATWDDHDFGINDGGGDYPKKKESQQLFLEWLKVPADSPRRKQEGVYHAQTFGPEGKRCQVILLDTRYHRSPLKVTPPEQRKLGGRYMADTNPQSTMLGEQQWQWLQEQLKQPAELRIVASSIQVMPSVHGGECWANMPLELERLMKLIGDTQAKGVLFISGDRHWSEFSSRAGPGGKPLYDFTSSSMTQKHARGTPTSNEHRVSKTTFHQPNAGLIHIDWEQRQTTVRVIDELGKTQLEWTCGF
jgi:alkaline phosphatase D